MNSDEPPQSQDPGGVNSSDPSPASLGPQGSEFIFYGALFEGGLIGLAFLLDYFGCSDPSQTWREFSWSGTIRPALIFGLLGTLPLLLYLWVEKWLRFWPFSTIEDISNSAIRPLFMGAATFEVVLISILAGWGEELLFRWAIQGGLSQWFGVGFGLLAGSVAFGLCHFLSPTYAFLTFLFGLYFGWMMIWTGTWLAPAITHGLFDFVSILYLTDRIRWPGRSSSH